MKFALPEEGPRGDEREEIVHIAEEEAVEEEDVQDEEVQSQSSASSEDYIIILPECFDTSRPLGDSMYSSALSQPGLERGAEGEPGIESGQEPAEARERLQERESQPKEQSMSDILTTSQPLDTVPLVPEVAGLPAALSRSAPCGQYEAPRVDSPVTIQEVPPVPDHVRGGNATLDLHLPPSAAFQRTPGINRLYVFEIRGLVQRLSLFPLSVFLPHAGVSTLKCIWRPYRGRHCTVLGERSLGSRPA